VLEIKIIWKILLWQNSRARGEERIIFIIDSFKILNNFYFGDERI
jgi:hypothetical protein